MHQLQGLLTAPHMKSSRVNAIAPQFFLRPIQEYPYPLTIANWTVGIIIHSTVLDVGHTRLNAEREAPAA